MGNQDWLCSQSVKQSKSSISNQKRLNGKYSDITEKKKTKMALYPQETSHIVFLAGQLGSLLQSLDQ